MNKTLNNVLLFTAGAAIGSVVTWKLVKTKYELIAQEEIDSVKETWARRMKEELGDDTANEDDEWDDEEYEDDDPDVITYKTLANMYNQSGDETEDDGEGAGDEEVPYINGPQVILPEDFGDGNYDHEMHCLTYYADGVLSNDWYERLDIDETIGEESLEHFGDYADDVVYVRNERLGADYEVTRDPRNYADMIANDPLMQTYED